MTVKRSFKTNKELIDSEKNPTVHPIYEDVYTIPIDLFRVDPNHIVRDFIKSPDLIYYYKNLMGDIRYKASVLEHAIKLTKAQRDHQIREENSSIKMTEVALNRLLDGDPEVHKSISEFADQERLVAKMYGVIDALERKHDVLKALVNLDQESSRQELEHIKRKEAS